ncbi:ctenidin-1-like [Drosophila tropicalis]|uniref:ctenidin-1-like n=1 Tax=Drosophila tropicalis TaxID=46794 RepID=UPI0035AB9AB8
MRLTLVALIGILCLAYVYALDDIDTSPNGEQPIGLLDVAGPAETHDNTGAREARGGYGGWGGGYGSGWRGGYGSGWRGGYGGGWGGRPGWGGGYGGGRWGGGRWGGGYGWGK